MPTPTRTAAAQPNRHGKLSTPEHDQPDYRASAPTSIGAAQFDPGNMSVSGCFTSESIDRSGDKVLVSGLVLDAHRKSPLGLYDHGRGGDVWRLPIGRWQ